MTLRQNEVISGTQFVLKLRPIFFVRKVCTASSIALLMGMIAFASTLLFDAHLNPAMAQSASCRGLERQLASLGSGGDGGSSRYRSAAKQQSSQISNIQSKMNGYGCAAKKRLFKREAHPQCRGLRSTLRKMKSNLRKLQRKAQGGSSKRSVERQRRRIKRRMNNRGCGTGDTRKASVKRSNIMEQIFGQSARKKRKKQAERDRRELKRERRRLRNKRDNGDEAPAERRFSNYNTVRTICVRRCDGYYFPVSFSTKKFLMDKDADACSNLCPGTEMELFYHKTSGQSAQQMISTVDGTPYTSLPNAFAYRKRFNAACSCNYRLLDRKAEPKPEPIDPQQELASERRTIGRIATPVWRVDRGQDPETIANVEGDLSQPVIEALNPEKKDERVVQTKRVRVIGEAFLPVQ